MCQSYMQWNRTFNNNGCHMNACVHETKLYTDVSAIIKGTVYLASIILLFLGGLLIKKISTHLCVSGCASEVDWVSWTFCRSAYIYGWTPYDQCSSCMSCAIMKIWNVLNIFFDIQTNKTYLPNANAHILPHSHAHTHTLSLSLSLTHSLTHTLTHACMRTHTHKHTHSLLFLLLFHTHI